MSRYAADSREPSLAAERTDLAWNRSGLSLVACGAAMLRGFARPPLTAGNFAVGACMLGLGVATWVLALWHARRASTGRGGRSSAADLFPVSLGVALVGVAAFVLAAVFPS